MTVPTREELEALADAHETWGRVSARQAVSKEPWYLNRHRDAATAANHFAVAASLRSIAAMRTE